MVFGDMGKIRRNDKFGEKEIRILLSEIPIYVKVIYENTSPGRSSKE